MRKNRSDVYQHLFHETYVSDEILSSYTNDRSISGLLNPFEYDEEVLDLEDELKKKFWLIANKVLTKNQKQIIKLTCDGYTQTEISKMLNIHQSSICKCLQGNTDYSALDEKGNPKVYGGAQKKLRKLVMSDPEIKLLLARINELKIEKL